MTQIFDHDKIRRNRDRALNSQNDFFMHQHIFKTMQQRLLDIKREFTNPLALSLAPHPDMPHKTPDSEILDVPDTAHDLILSAMTLHMVNDLPGMLIQIRQALQPDGAFLFALPGADTLKTTRECIINAEMSLHGGANARFHPMIGLQQMAGLMQRTGFALPVVDQERITVSAPSLLSGVRDIRLAGENAALHGYKARPITKDVLRKIEETHPRNKDGHFEFLIDMIYGIGWAPAPSQPQPLKRGSATTSLSEVLS